MNLFASPKSIKLVEHALKLIGNIAGDNRLYRDLVIENGLIDHLLTFKRISISFSRTVVSVIMNLVRCTDPQISLENGAKIIHMINKLMTINDITTKNDALLALSYIVYCNKEYNQIVIESGAIATIVPLLSSHCYSFMLAAMSVLGTVATGTNEQIDVLMANDILIHIRHPLWHQNEVLCQRALWCLSNITAGTQEHMQAVMESVILVQIVEGLSRPEKETRKEALLLIRNLIANGSADQIILIIQAGAVIPLVKLMKHNDEEIDEEITMIAIQSLKNLFYKSPSLVKWYAELYEQVMQMP